MKGRNLYHLYINNNRIIYLNITKLKNGYNKNIAIIIIFNYFLLILKN